MGQFIDMTGRRFGRLVAVSKTDERSANGSVKWLFKCDCGNEAIIDGSSVRNGLIKSCGCYHSECATKLCISRRVHGEEPQRLYNIWCGMKGRCNNPNAPKYPRYGARGIKVCKEWVSDFTAFRDWALSHGYADNLSIDRIDNDGNYEPGNCRWVTNKQQSRNRSTNHMIEYQGKNISLMEYAEKTGMNYNTLKERIYNGRWSENGLEQVCD